MKYFVIAGETSGDLHGSNLIKHLKEIDTNASFTFVGGDKMSSQVGNPPLLHTKDLNFMGFVEVIKNLSTINKNLNLVKNKLQEVRPDSIILIDFPGFNMRVAKFAKSLGIPVYYYISPKIWAWNQSRVHKIKKYVDQMYCILPFEKTFYKKYGMQVEYVGNPIMDSIQNYPYNENFNKDHQLNDRPIIALLPGSREMEVAKILPILAELRFSFPAHQIIIAGAPNLDEAFYRKHLGDIDIPIIYNQTYDLLKVASAAVVTSGTATLETALFKVPQVVVYKANPLTIALGRMVIQVKYISLVNLINDFLSVRELIQKECTSYNIASELDLLLNSKSYRDNILENYDILQEKVGEAGASKRTAEHIYKNLTKKN